jgi:hypothetical protein
MTSDARGQSIAVRPGSSPELVTAATRALLEHLTARRHRDVIVETINGESAPASPLASAFQAAGLRLTTSGLRYYASFARD